jgi:hypothetical protein
VRTTNADRLRPKRWLHLHCGGRRCHVWSDGCLFGEYACQLCQIEIGKASAVLLRQGLLLGLTTVGNVQLDQFAYEDRPLAGD